MYFPDLNGFYYLLFYVIYRLSYIIIFTLQTTNYNNGVTITLSPTINLQSTTTEIKTGPPTTKYIHFDFCLIYYRYYQAYT